MRALVFDGKLHLRTDYPDPVPAPGESIVKISLAGVCGTDLEITRGYMEYRGVPGHEFVGRVVQSEIASLAGKRVVGEINASCRTCNSCIDGMGRHCPTRTVLGILGRDGAFAEYLRLPNANLFSLPDSVTDEAAVFTEPFAAACEIFDQTHLKRTDRIAVLGDGRLGALVALALRGENFAPVVAGHHPEKLKRLAALGLQTQSADELAPGYDAVVDCTGQSAGFSSAIALVRPRGTVILKSTAAAGAAMNLAPVVINEITIIGSRCGRFGPAIDALAARKFDPRPLIDATYSLDDGVAAFTAAADKSKFKIVIRP
ncbi:MAG: alcohol dehydrogenase catalytic domain-containing protein [Candidatus Binataceae bacterium]|jgi:alcohol dehydrogenase